MKWFRKKYEKVDSWYSQMVIREIEQMWERHKKYGNPYDFPKGDKTYEIK